MLSIQNLFFQPRDPTNLLKAKQRVGIIQGDHLTLLNIFKQWKNCKTSRSKFCKDIYLNENGMKQADEMIKNLKPYMPMAPNSTTLEVMRSIHLFPINHFWMSYGIMTLYSERA